MSDLLNQKISQYLDGDLNPSESVQLLSHMQQQPQLQRTLQRYELIQQALKARPVLSADALFAEQVQARLAQEPHYLLPKRKPKARPYRTAVWALAASLAMVAVIVPMVKTIHERLPMSAMTLAQQERARGQAEDVKLNEAALAAMLTQHELQSMQFNSVNRQQANMQAYESGLYTNGAVDLRYPGQLANYGSGE